MSVTKNSLSFFVLIICLITKGLCQSKVFRLDDYGVDKSGNVDNSQAILKAWNDACKWKGGSKLVISSGTYLVNPIILKGPCNGPIEFQNLGTLKAPSPATAESWIEFRYINKLLLNGGGIYDGQGPPRDGSSHFRTMLRFSFVTNSKARNVKLINSQGVHFILFGVTNTILDRITIKSPEDSHNTDGIKIGTSKGISIINSDIGTGDDCVALLTGSKNISIIGVNCGPGHGISIGSMGTSPNEKVKDVFVKDCNLYGTTNGLRIKTKKTDYPGLVSNINYEGIVFDKVENPIIFDQNYCVTGSCGQGLTSKVQIRNVKFKNIRGTSSSKIAVDLECSRSTPCQQIELRDIDIRYQLPQEDSTCKCSNVNGKTYGVQIPTPCNALTKSL